MHLLGQPAHGGCIGVISDTHGLLRPEALKALEGVDRILHAGDIGNPDHLAALARIAAEVNRSVENIGARRLYTVIERVFEELSFTAPDRNGDVVTVDGEFVERHLGDLSRSADLSRYVL